MRKYRITAFVIAFFMLLAGVGCTPETVTPSSVSSKPDSSAVSYVKAEDLKLDLPASQLWTWNDLYDYLENPLKSGNLAFDDEKGEYIILYDTDGKTILTDWKLPIKQDMLVIQYAADDTILRRLSVNLTGQTTPSKPDETTHHPGKEEPSSQESKPTSSIPKSPSSADSSQPIVTPPKTVITLQAGTDNSSVKTAIEAFNRQSKTVEVRLSETADRMTAARLSQLIQDQAAPDIVMMNRSEMAFASVKSLLIDCSSLGADRLEPLFDSVCWNKTTINGKRYGLPVGCVTSCLACNDEILYRSQTGVPTNFEDLLSYAQTIREVLPGVTPMGLITDPDDSTAMAEQFTMILWSFGGSLLTPDHRAALFYSIPGYETMECYQQWQQKELIGQNVRKEDFLAGETAYGIVPCTWYSKTFGRQAKDNYTAAPLIMPGEKQAVSLLDLYAYCIPKTTPARQQAAYEFLQFYFSDADYSLSECKSEDWIPSLTAAREDSYYQTDAWQVFIDAIPTARLCPSPDCMETIFGYLAEAVNSVLSGVNPEIALEKAKEKTENRLKRD